MSYPGTPSLPSPVKDRVVSTFQQTLALYRQGRIDEVTAGCNLILQMDPQFDPARKLLEKTRNPSLPLDLDALLPAEELPTVEQARQAMAARDFTRVIHLTSEILSEDLMNDDARVLADEAREKLEAAPFVQQFARKSEQALDAGNLTGARMELEKARALDPTHPDVIRAGRALSEREKTPRSAPPPPSSSFVVDDTSQQATGRTAAQAADFGFTFEEDKPTDKPAAPSFANFSFDAPATPAQESGFGDFSFGGGDASADAFGSFSFDAPATPAAPAPEPTKITDALNEFDFTTASVATSDDEQKKIDQYLADGDRAFDAGDYQQAIDLWSRIFLIDVTNDAASERIERAKVKRRQIEQQVDELLDSAIAAFDRRDLARARSEFTEILRVDPRNSTAEDYLARIDDAAAGGATEAVIPPSANDKLDLDFFDDAPMSGGETLIPPDPGTVAAAPPVQSGAKAKRAAAATAPQARPATARRLPVGLLAAILGIVILAGAGYFAYTKFSGGDEPAPTTSQATFARASSLANSGKFDQAIALLQDVKPDDPQHDRALVMIADLQQRKSKSAQLIEGMPAAVYYQQRLTTAAAAIASHDYSAAKTAFEDAMKVRPLPADMKAQYDMAAAQAGKLDSARALFAEHKYADALGDLQPLLAQDPQNANVQRMILDAHFNLGVTALQEERLPDASREFDEVLKVNPNDELAKRSRALAGRYDGQPKDLLYKIYVKYLPLRQG
ncbi:MAG TPA: tetratricopeptide repeat protein [Thermoanaerobaculia bacterium]|jgi:tetratricopeptide (TPR) repeat protein